MIGFNFCKKTLALLLALILCIGVFVPAALADPDEETEEAEETVLDSGLPIPLASPSEIVIELSSNTVLLSRDPDRQVNPGSIAKIAALYVLCSECFKGRIDLKTQVTITSEMMAGGKGVIALKQDEVVTFQDLLYLMYSDYSDTAAYAAAIAAVGSVDNLVKEMNSFAKSCQCTNTLFTNITGDYDENMHITPADLVLLLRRAMQNSLFMEVFTARSYIVPETNKSISRSLSSSILLRRSSSDYYRAGCRGGRFAGFEEGYTVVALAEKEESEMQLLIIASGGLTADESYTDAGKLIDWVLETFEWRTLCHAGEAVASVPVEMGRGSDHVNIGPANDISAMLDIGLDTELFTRKVTLYDESITAPVEKGTVLGEVSILFQGEEYAHAALVANSPVELNTVSYLKNKVQETAGERGILKLIKIVGILLVCYLIYAFVHWVLRIITRIHRLQKKQNLRKERRRNARTYDPELPESNTRRIAIYRTENGLSEAVPEPFDNMANHDGAQVVFDNLQEEKYAEEALDDTVADFNIPDGSIETEQKETGKNRLNLFQKLKSAVNTVIEELSGTAYEPENPAALSEEPEVLLEEINEEPEVELEEYEPVEESMPEQDITSDLERTDENE